MCPRNVLCKMLRHHKHSQIGDQESDYWKGVRPRLDGKMLWENLFHQFEKFETSVYALERRDAVSTAAVKLLSILVASGEITYNSANSRAARRAPTQNRSIQTKWGQ